MLLGSPEDRRDFGITEFTVTFEVDEGTTSPNNDVPVPVPVRDDEFDEADEEVFIIILSVNNGTNTEGIMIMRDAALCRIGDNDSKFCLDIISSLQGIMLYRV